MNNVRQFTREEDELILQQSQGMFTVGWLEGHLKTTRVTLERRAEELGVALYVRHRARVYRYGETRAEVQPSREQDDRPWGNFVSGDCGENPCKIPHDDPLLEALFKHHGDRRYVSMQIKSKLLF